MDKLHVKAVDAVMVPDTAAAMNGVRRFIGRKVRAPWPISEPVMVPVRSDIVAAVKAGELEAADAATAAFCGVKFAAPAAK